ncbi:MAG TPA: type II secretion system secretin GspD, partial [Steroidobacteraceae bacterium]
RGFCLLFARAPLALLGAAALASAQPVAPGVGQPGQATVLGQPQQRITPNFKDADITQIAEAVAAATGKNFIMDPRVRAQVTMLSSTPMSPEGFYQAFLSILAVYDFIAVPDGNVVKILPDANARQMPSIDLPDHVSATSDEIVTQVIDVKNVNAAQLVPILRPMIPQYGHLAAYPAGNILIISDRASNVNRMIRIIRRIDQVGDQDVEIVQLHDASAAEIVRVMNSLYQGAAAAAEGGTPMKVVADERSNSVLISGDQNQRLRIRALIAHLDTPLEAGGDTRVRYLHYADADKIAPKLKEQMTGIAQQTAGAGGGAPGAGASPQAQAEKNSLIWADPSNNALVITAPPKIMRQIMAIVDKLDIRRPQVLVQAIIADVNVSKDAELGVNWAAYGTGSNVPAAGFVSPVGGTSIVDLATAIENPANVTSTLLSGTTLGVGRIGGGSINFAAVLRAIQTDSHSNVIATPSAMTMDNQEAELKSAEEVPFVTGQFSNTGSTNNGQVNPFQTIQREEVGTILKVTPTISPEGTAVMMKLSIESSSLAQRPAGAVDIATNKRTVTTTVLIEDGGIVVLGGLISENNQRQESRVPFLGSIPIIGLAFKTRSATTEKDNLMIFIRPKILRDQAQAAYETDLKYNYMQDQQKSFEHREIPPLLPGEHQPRLPPLPPPPPPGTQAAPISSEEKQKAAEAQGKADDALYRRSLTPQSGPILPAPAATPSPQSSTTSPGLPAPSEPAATTSPPQDGGKR